MEGWTYEILEDGTVKITTGKVGQEIHANAEGFLSFIAKAMGGKTVRERRGTHAAHTHTAENKQTN